MRLYAIFINYMANSHNFDISDNPASLRSAF